MVTWGSGLGKDHGGNLEGDEGILFSIVIVINIDSYLSKLNYTLKISAVIVYISYLSKTDIRKINHTLHKLGGEINLTEIIEKLYFKIQIT